MSRGELPGEPPERRRTPDGRRTTAGVRAEDADRREEPERAVLSALVKHEPGVLAEAAGLFSRRQFNIESLTVGETIDDSLARMTIVIEETRPNIDQAKKQLEKRIPVISVRELDDAVKRELVILKVEGEAPDQVNAVTEMYDGETLDAGPETITVEITGDGDRIDAAVDAYRQFGIRELTRTGYAALARGAAPTAQVSEPNQAPTAAQVETETIADD